MSHSNYTQPNDTAARADSARDARHNGGDWPTGGYHWRCNDRLPRRQHWTYWKHGGLVSLLNWNRAIRRERAGLWTPMNITPSIAKPTPERDARLFMLTFKDIHRIEDDGFCYNHALFVSAKTEDGARSVVIANDPTLYGVLDMDYPMQIFHLGATDKPLGFCADDWTLIPDDRWPDICLAMGWDYMP